MSDVSGPALGPARNADVANVLHLLDVLASARPAGRLAAKGVRFGDGDVLGPEIDSARTFLGHLELALNLEPMPALSDPSVTWTWETLDRLVAVARTGPIRLRVAGIDVDTRQPGSVAGPEPGELPGVALAGAGGTPEPRYRAPLEGTIPPPREWRCGTCASRRDDRATTNPGAGCDCGGEWELYDVKPAECCGIARDTYPCSNCPDVARGIIPPDSHAPAEGS